VYCPRNILRPDRTYSLQEGRTLVAHGFAFLARGRVHDKARHDLKQMTLQYVAVGAGRVIEAAAILNAKVFGQGDLDAAHMVAVPYRFKHRIGEACVEQVLHRLLSKEVIDAEDVPLREVLPQHLIQLAGRCAIMTE
jgi:hypothetical protein